MELGKPPVVEAWIEFRFSINESSSQWDEATAEHFIKHYFADAFRVRTYEGRTTFTLQNTGVRPNISDSKVVFERIKASNPDEDRYLQVGRDLLVYNILRKQDSWPEYSTLEKEALDAFEKYVRFQRPTGLLQLALHYRDIVPVPIDADKRVDLRTYFRIYPEMPDDHFPAALGFRLGLVFPIGRAGTLRVDMRDEVVPGLASQLGASERPIRIDWHMILKESMPLETERVQGWLANAHGDLLRYFRNLFTERGWQLFDPKEP